MISKALGYLIGGLFLLAFLSPVPISIWLVYDRIDVYLNSSKQQATITHCYSHRSSGNNSRLSFGPVAVTQSGQKVKGDFKWSKRKWCEYGIGSQVTVLLKNNDMEDSRIFTFLQFWSLPLFFLFISFVLYPAMYIAKRKKDQREIKE